MVLSLFHTYCHHSYRKKTKQMVINNLPAISHVFKTSYTPILHVFETSHIPILHVFEVLAKKLGQKKQHRACCDGTRPMLIVVMKKLCEECD